MTRARRGLLYRTPQRPPRPRGSLANRPRRTMTRPRRLFTRRTRRTRPSRRASRRPVPSRPPRTGRIKTRRTSPGSRRPRRSRLRKRRRVPPARRPRQERKALEVFLLQRRRRGTPTDRTRGRVRCRVRRRADRLATRKEKGARVSRGTTPPDAPPGMRPFYEHLAPSRWRDARLPEARRDAQSARLFADAVRRRETKRAVADAPVPRTRWSGAPASRLGAGFRASRATPRRSWRTARRSPCPTGHRQA